MSLVDAAAGHGSLLLFRAVVRTMYIHTKLNHQAWQHVAHLRDAIIDTIPSILDVSTYYMDLSVLIMEYNELRHAARSRRLAAPSLCANF